eukprot:gene12939-biopygen18525
MGAAGRAGAAFIGKTNMSGVGVQPRTCAVSAQKGGLRHKPAGSDRTSWRVHAPCVRVANRKPDMHKWGGGTEGWVAAYWVGTNAGGAPRSSLGRAPIVCRHTTPQVQRSVRDKTTLESGIGTFHRTPDAIGGTGGGREGRSAQARAVGCARCVAGITPRSGPGGVHCRVVGPRYASRVRIKGRYWAGRRHSREAAASAALS